MIQRIRVGVQIQPAGTPDYRTWRAAVIKADDIKAILYLGIKGDIKLDTGKKHAVDTYA